MEPTSQFNKSLDFVLRWEGGYVNDPNDPGGETKFGISKRAYPEENIKDLTRARASELYKRDYWDVMHCSDHDPRMACVVFDTCVNCGIARCAIWLEGEATPEGLIAHRKHHYQDLAKRKPLMAKYLKGWMNRVAALEKFIQTV